MRGLDEIELYLLTCAQLMGAKASDDGDRARLVREKISEIQGNYSLQWYYRYYLHEDLQYGDLHEDLQYDGPANSLPAAKLNLLKAFLQQASRLTGEADVFPLLPEAKFLRENLDSWKNQAQGISEELSNNQEEWFLGENLLNDSQVKAIAKALAYPISFVQGPPGTGKTMMIVRLIALAVEKGMKVAVVSTNGTAVENVYKKLENICSGGEEKYGSRLYEAAKKSVKLGNSNERCNGASYVYPWFKVTCGKGNAGRPFVSFKKEENAPHDYEGIDTPNDKGQRSGWEKRQRFKDFTDDFPVVLCKIHSLKKCFIDGALPDNKFDLVIVDEASQIDLIVGLVALSSAKRMVVVGDEEQLAPIYKNRADLIGRPWQQSKDPHEPVWKEDSWYTAPRWEEGRKQLQNFKGSELEICLDGDRNSTRQDESFLTVTKKVFAQLYGTQDAETFLNVHYRCHPGIFGFSKKLIYEKAKFTCDCQREKARADSKSIRLPEQKNWPVYADVVCPISITWYSGDYREKLASQGDPKESASPQNKRQLEILKFDHLRHVAELLQKGADEGKGATVCVLSPYKRQVEEFSKLLAELLEASNSWNGDEHKESEEGEGTLPELPSGFEFTLKQMNDRVKRLTVHKAQGQEYDAVYLLPVDDGQWEGQWSQGKRLINVAVSRAKNELHVILSTKMLDYERQVELTGSFTPVKYPVPKDPNEGELYLRLLERYVRCTQGKYYQHELFGIRQTSVRSILDDLTRYQTPDDNDKEGSAPEDCVQVELAKVLAKINSSLDTEVELYREVVIGKKEDAKAGSENTEDPHRAPDIQEEKNQAHLTLAGEIVDAKKLIDKVRGKRFDFCLADKKTKRILLIIEVDGENHRNPNNEKIKESDRLKNEFIEKIGGEVLNPENSSTQPSKYPILLRIPTDGTSKWETDDLLKTGRNQQRATCVEHQDLNLDTLKLANFEDYQARTIEALIKLAQKKAHENPVTLVVEPEEENETGPSREGGEFKRLLQFQEEWKKLEAKWGEKGVPVPEVMKCDAVFAAVEQPWMNLQKALEKQGFLEKCIDEENRWRPTPAGKALGLRRYVDQDKTGKKFSNLEYSRTARVYLRYNLHSILGDPRKERLQPDNR